VGERAEDLLLASIILVLISPLLGLVALAVKVSSPGPTIFKQRRYGLDGRSILIYKFRTMTVCEGGDRMPQAGRSDARVTPLGSFLRRTSLDELPQFVNVLQGRMSIVGQRPHVVAHNEQYRGLIKGYMLHRTDDLQRACRQERVLSGAQSPDAFPPVTNTVFTAEAAMVTVPPCGALIVAVCPDPLLIVYTASCSGSVTVNPAAGAPRRTR
jgi:sugar transferase